VIGARERP
jgi:chaperonin GroEL (HSP60 family)